MSFGSPTPIEVAVQGPNLANEPRLRRKDPRASWRRSPACAICSTRQPLDYPTVEVAIDRERAGQFGLTMANVARSLVAATSSSRFIEPNYWRDPASGNAFQIQVEIPQQKMASLDDVRNIPVMAGRRRRARCSATSPTCGYGTTMGRGRPLQHAARGQPDGQHPRRARWATRHATCARPSGAPAPRRRGVTVNVRGQIPPLEQTIAGLRVGLLLSDRGDLPAAGGQFPVGAAGAGGALHRAGGAVRRGADAAASPARRSTCSRSWAPSWRSASRWPTPSCS